MKISKYNESYENDIKDLLCELQDYIVNLDEYKIQILSNNYREDYFNNMLKKIKTSKGIIYVAVEGPNVLGFIAGTVEKVDEVDQLTVGLSKYGRIEEMCVKNKTRNNGVGTLLIKKIEEYLKNEGCDFTYIDVFGPNVKAQNFYYKNGYNLRNIEVMKKID